MSIVTTFFFNTDRALSDVVQENRFTCLEEYMWIPPDWTGLLLSVLVSLFKWRKSLRDSGPCFFFFKEKQTPLALFYLCAPPPSQIVKYNFKI